MKIEKGIEEVLNKLDVLEVKIDSIGNIVYDKLVVKENQNVKEGRRKKNKIKWKEERKKKIKEDKGEKGFEVNLHE